MGIGGGAIFGLTGKGIWAAGVAMPTTSPSDAGRAIGRNVSACSTRNSARTTNASPTRMQPPVIATIPGVTLVASKACWLNEKPDAIRPNPAAMMTAPSVNKNAYITRPPATELTLR